jgi:type I restriction enzyme S subunit
MNGLEKGSLPDGWRCVRLGEVGRFESGGTPSKDNPNFWNGHIPFITGADVTDFHISSKNARAFLTDAGLASGKTAVCHPGTVLFVTRTRVGRVGIATETMGASQDLSPYICGPEILPEYACRYLLSVSDYLSGNCRGATIQGLTRDFVHSLEIPLPALSEQKRIATILSQQMAAMERARAAAEAQLEAAKDLPAAYLRAVFNNAEAEKWPRKALGEVGQIVSGVTLGRKINGAKTRSVPYLRVANVKDERLDLSDVYQIEATEAEIQKLRLQSGDLLLTEGGDPDKLGRGTFWEQQIPECIHQNHIFRVRFDLNDFSPQFVSAQIASPYGKSYFLAHAKRTTGIATINQKVLAGFPLMVPPMSEQKHITALLSEQMAAAEWTRKALEEQLDTINKLPAVLLRRAFSGEL